MLQLAQVTNEDEASYQRVRQGLIEFVEQLDHLLLMVSKHGASNRRFVKTVTDVVSSIMDRPPLRRLRGRAREATKADYLDRSVTNSLKSALDNFNRRN